jgi:CrcB protein
MSWQTILAIGSGGFVGAILRSYLNGLISHKFPHDLPFGTLGVNLLGSFIMGMLIAYFMYISVGVHVKSFLTTGILGALTTYSTFAIESFLLFHGGSYLLGITNMLLNVVGTVLASALGYLGVQAIFK